MKKHLFIPAAALIALASCSNEEVIEQTRKGDGIDFRAAIVQGSTSRGVETTQATLSQFYVTAMYGNLEWFGNVLFTKGADNLFESEEDYLWPGHGSLDFYAWSYNSGTEGYIPNALDPDKYGEVYIDATTQTITFTPDTVVPNQIDLVTAFKTASKSDVDQNGIGLEFTHALCEIQINAKSETNDYAFAVHGVKVGCVNKSGVLALKPTAVAQDDDNSTSSNSGPWSFPTSDKTDYTVILDSPIVLADESIEISAASKSNVGFIMPIPQSLTAWIHDGDPTNSREGAYLAVLVKITNKDTNQEAYPRRASEGAHRVGESSELAGYGWACVPISSTWQPGYRYVYNLDFSYGAGQFSPDDEDQPGEDILGGPIKFNVSVSGWVSGDDINVNMNGHDTDEQSGDYSVPD